MCNTYPPTLRKKAYLKKRCTKIVIKLKWLTSVVLSDLTNWWRAQQSVCCSSEIQKLVFAPECHHLISKIVTDDWINLGFLFEFMGCLQHRTAESQNTERSEQTNMVTLCSRMFSTVPLINLSPWYFGIFKCLWNITCTIKISLGVCILIRRTCVFKGVT